MRSSVQQRVEKLLERAGLTLPVLVHYESLSRGGMQHLAACSGIPRRYIYPWVADRISRDLPPPWEIVAYSPLGGLVYLQEQLAISEDRVIAHATAHAHLFQHHKAWQHCISAEVLGEQSRYRMGALERTVGRDLLWAFLDSCSEADVENTVRLTEPWHFVALQQVENERAYLAPFKDCQLLAEGFASYWEFRITGDCMDSGPYRLGRILVEQAYAQNHVASLYELSDTGLVRAYYSPQIATRYGYPWVSWQSAGELRELTELLVRY